MKLELKHLAPYLPYGLIFHHEIIQKKLTMIGCEFTHELRIRFTDGLYAYDVCKLKPILRPLSDLTKEIEVNDEKFVPIVELAKLFHTCKSAITHFSNIVNAGFYGASVNCHIENDDSRFTYYQLRNDEFVLSNTYDEIQKLLEWHFDVFGLIEQGLAVDINTLEK